MRVSRLATFTKISFPIWLSPPFFGPTSAEAIATIVAGRSAVLLPHHMIPSATQPVREAVRRRRRGGYGRRVFDHQANFPLLQISLRARLFRDTIGPSQIGRLMLKFRVLAVRLG